MSAFESAIDDAFEPTPQPLPEDYNDDELLFDNACNGPRDGHWDVTSSVGSFVDDRCPTVYGYSPVAHGTRHGMQVDGGLAKRLMQATIEEKRAVAAPVSASRVASSAKVQFASEQSDAKPPKRFVVPPLRNKSTAPITQQRKYGPKDATENTNSAREGYEAKDKPRSTMTPLVPVPAPAPKVATSKAASDTPRQGLPNVRVIRILGKNGEEAFVPMPSLPMMLSRHRAHDRLSVASGPQHRSSPAASSKKERDLREFASNDGVRDPISPEANNMTIAAPKQKKKQRQQQKQEQKQKSQEAIQQQTPERAQSHRSDSWMMSGALPVPSEKASPAAHPCNDSGIVINDNFGITSKSSSFKASSWKAGSAKSGSAISQDVLDIAEKIAKMPSATSKKSRSARDEPTGWTFEEAGVGLTTGFPAEQPASNRSAMKPHKTSQQGSQRAVSSKRNSPRSQDQGSVHGTLRSNYQPPTVHSGSSSSSIVHSFGNMYQDGFVPQAGPSSVGSQHGSAGSQRGLSNRTKSDKTRSKLSTVHTGSDAARCNKALSPLNAMGGLSIVPGTPSPSPVSPLASSPEPSRFGRQPTNFAGDGWISPHPLSVASTDIGAAPQSEVYISRDGTGHCGTLTYSEWRAQRDAAGSVAGSFVGSDVPSIVGLQSVPPTAYNHPPPASYVGSYHEMTRQPQHAYSQPASNHTWGSHHGSWAAGSVGTYRHGSAQEEQCSSSNLSSAHSQAQSADMFYHNTVYNDPAHQAPQDAAWDFPSQQGRLGYATYNVGLTPTQLSHYQSRLGDTVSHYSSQLSQVQQAQTPSQPDYTPWNTSQSHRSPSVHNLHPNQSYPPEKTQLTMPWDQQAPSHLIPAHSHSLHSSVGGSHAPGSFAGSGLSHQPLQDYGSRASNASHQTAVASPSQVTYGSAEWEGLENAEVGRGGFVSYRMW